LSAARIFNHARALAVGLHQVVDVEHRFAEELLRALVVQFQQAALDGADAGVEMLPYSVVKSLALSPTCCTIARRSLKSSNSSPLSSRS